MIRDASGFSITYLDFYHAEQCRSSTGRMTKDEARRIAVNMARLPEMLQAEKERSGAP